MNINIKQLVIDYLNSLDAKKLLLENFNEKSLQHNLGQYLKEKLGSNYVVQYERNIKYFKLLNYMNLHSKSEIDLVILNKDDPRKIHSNGKPTYIIELKFIKAYDQSLKKQVASPTKALLECLYDIEFVEQCKNNKIEALSLILCDYNKVNSDVIFSRGRKQKNNELWDAFRKGKTLSKKIIKEINKNINNGKINIKSNPSLSWTDLITYNDEEGHQGLKLKYIIN